MPRVELPAMLDRRTPDRFQQCWVLHSQRCAGPRGVCQLLRRELLTNRGKPQLFQLLRVLHHHAQAALAMPCGVTPQILSIAAELVALGSSESSAASVERARAVMARSCALNSHIFHSSAYFTASCSSESSTAGVAKAHAVLANS